MKTVRQFVRFATVGLASNVLLFLLYLLATQLGAGPKSAMTALYVLGVCITFAFNRNWSFTHDGGISTAMFRYGLVYIAGYAVNWLVLYILVDRLDWPHQWVQGAMILLLAVALFLSQKFWVFREQAIS